MVSEKIALRKEEAGLKTPTLATYVLYDPLEQNRKRPAVLICPGGGYGSCSPREAEPIAMKFAAAGYQAFVLDYSVAPAKYPRALEEASMAMALIREKSEEWSVDVDKIAVCGFSAGGHLAGNLANCWAEENLASFNGQNRPNAAILCYPVLTAGEFAHQGSFENLLTDPTDQAARDRVCIEKHVSANTPPTFLWHTVADNCVPVENSLIMATELQKAKIPFALHIYPEGCHGLSLANSEVCGELENYYPHVATWMPLAIEWLDNLFGKAHN